MFKCFGVEKKPEVKEFEIVETSTPFYIRVNGIGEGYVEKSGKDGLYRAVLLGSDVKWGSSSLDAISETLKKLNNKE